MLKRLTCMLLDHNWTRHRYESAESYDQPEGTYLKCVRCGRISESEGLPGGPMSRRDVMQGRRRATRLYLHPLRLRVA